MPDNDYYNLRAEYARSMPEFWRGRFTGVVSWSRMKQDDKLIPPTDFSLAGGTINGVPTDNVWNTTRALSRDSAEAEIDSLLLDFGLTLRPTPKLGLRGKVRYQSTDNKMDYATCNPLTGQWGRLLNDGSGGSFVVPNATPGNNPAGTSPFAYDATGCNLAATRASGLVPSSGSVPIRSVPYEYSRLNLELGGDYRLAPGQVLDAHLMREDWHREYRERDHVWETSLKLGYVNRAFDFGTLRMHGTYGQRRGDDYDLNVNDAYLSAFLGPEPVAGDVHSWLRAPYGFRKFDIADRDILDLNARLQWIAAKALDVGLGLQYSDIDYPNSIWGRTDTQRLAGVNLDVNWQPSSRLGLWAHYGYQQGHIEQHGVAPTFSFRGGGCVIGRGSATATNWRDYCSVVAPDNTLFPSTLAWDVTSNDRNHALGAGLFYDFGPARLELDYSYSTGTSEIDYDYDYDARGQGFTPDQLALIGGGMPDLDTSRQILNLNLVVPINKTFAVRALYRYEQGSVDDWHYDGVAENPVPAANAVYLDSGLLDYHASVIGLLLQASF